MYHIVLLNQNEPSFTKELFEKLSRKTLLFAPPCCSYRVCSDVRSCRLLEQHSVIATGEDNGTAAAALYTRLPEDEPSVVGEDDAAVAAPAVAPACLSIGV